MKIILASASPRRKELIHQLFDEVLILPQNVDENILENDPKILVQKLAKMKLNNLDNLYKDDLIISADTIVYYNNKVYGKPKDYKDAFKILSELNGKTHIVYTGVCIAYKGEIYTLLEESKVTFKNMTDKQINKYIMDKKPLDKAGAYGIQDEEVVDYYSGSYTNIVGLPLEIIKDKLIKLGVLAA